MTKIYGVLHGNKSIRPEITAFLLKNDQTNKKSKKKQRVREIIKTENIGKKELAAPPYHRINRFFDFSSMKIANL